HVIHLYPGVIFAQLIQGVKRIALKQLMIEKCPEEFDAMPKQWSDSFKTSPYSLPAWGRHLERALICRDIDFAEPAMHSHNVSPNTRRHIPLLNIPEHKSVLLDNLNDQMSNSNSNGSMSQIIASSDGQPPFDNLLERNPASKQREVYAQYKPLSGLRNIPLPGTLHWAVQVVSTTEIAHDEPGYIWELAQQELKLRINLDRRGDLSSEILNNMNTNNFGLLDEAARLYLRPMGFAHSREKLMHPVIQLKNKTPEEAKAYDMLIRNCQDFAERLKESICEEKHQNITRSNPEPASRKRRRLRKKTGKFLKVIFRGSRTGFRKLGTRFWKMAGLSSLSNPQFIMPPPR
ncbi:MAG: hypothetical protein Q9172_004136, partial [Xanthocarpia lactea]